MPDKLMRKFLVPAGKPLVTTVVIASTLDAPLVWKSGSAATEITAEITSVASRLRVNGAMRNAVLPVPQPWLWPALAFWQQAWPGLFWRLAWRRLSWRRAPF